MSAVPQAKPRMTVEEFFAFDGGGHVGKLELVDGVIRAQSYASGGHATIQGNLARLIGNHLVSQRPGCRLGTEAGVIPRFDPSHNIRKPDLSVTCTPHTTGEWAFPDPILIVEVLSPTNSDDTWESIRACATVPTVAETLVLDSERVWAEVFRKDAKGNWPEPGDVVEPGGTIRLESIGADWPIAEIYRWTTLAG